MDLGLDSLAAELEAEGNASGGSVTLDIALISADPDQPRTEFDEEKLQRLADSIKAQGVIQPIVVRQDAMDFDRYIIIAGERRWRASQLAKLDTIPAIIKDADNTEIVASQIIENIDREDFTLLDEVRAVARMCEICGNATKAGEALGKGKGWISKRMAIAKGGETIERFIIEGGTSDLLGIYQLSRVFKKYPQDAEIFVNAWISDPENRVNLRQKVDDLMAGLDNPAPVSETKSSASATDSGSAQSTVMDDVNSTEKPSQVATDSAKTAPAPEKQSVTIQTNATDSVQATDTQPDADLAETVESFEVQGDVVVLRTPLRQIVVNAAMIEEIRNEF